MLRKINASSFLTCWTVSSNPWPSEWRAPYGADKVKHFHFQEIPQKYFWNNYTIMKTFYHGFSSAFLSLSQNNNDICSTNRIWNYRIWNWIEYEIEYETVFLCILCRICPSQARGQKDRDRYSIDANWDQTPWNIWFLSASLNVAINDVGSFCNIVIMMPFLMRIFFGQLTELEKMWDMHIHAHILYAYTRIYVNANAWQGG